MPSMTLARAVALALILSAIAVADAEARSRHRHARGDSVAVTLLKKQAVELEALRREIAAFRKLLRPDVASLPESVPMPPPRNSALPVAALPDVRKAPDATAAALGNIHGLKPAFLAKLASLRAAMPAGMGFRVGSGFRSHAQQARLHAQKPGLAARPGHSNHERGLAGDLKFYGTGASRWVHRYARQHGLRFPMAHEPWHIEPAGLTRYAKRRHHRSASAG